ncbi:hypothetical protein [Noviherbaspirillum aridicola]|uniref:Uncharacterized protein n=1 Tax=Noviherbaspirillum aridicola TaxID=2849687 RepID=A0ABQ4Q0A1_9BURK|nr:hypothetical protein [Noviherbaspirillum aridicola]GIZ50564.1 hypothetical protein NCCP691_05780 [Noviherbaspirillum aridicola]
MSAIPDELALAVLVVVLFASRRYDLPSSIREDTTALGYGIGICGYVSVSVLLYFVLYSLCLKLSLPAPAYLSLALALICWRLPAASVVDARLRESFQRVAGAPDEARRLAAMLGPERFRPSNALQQEARAILLLRGYDADDDWLPAAEPVRKLWLHAAMCFFLVKDWEKHDADPGFRRFMNGRARQDFDSLRQRFDQLSCQVVRVMATVEKLADLWVEEADADGGGPRADDKRLIVTELISDLREDIEFFVDNLSLFIARGVLSCSLTDARRQRRLSRMGFRTAPLAPSLSATLFWIGLFYFFAFAVAALLYGSTPLHRPEGALWILVLAATQTIAVAVAIVPKRMAGFANEDLYGNTPWAFVLGAGVAAVALAVMLRILLIPNAMERLNSAPVFWLLSPFSTAATTAWLVQDSRWSHTGLLRARRSLDALVLTIAAGATTVIVRSLQFLVFDQAWSVSRLPFDAGMALAVGVVVGYNVPWRFRHRVPAVGTRTARSTGRGLFALLRTHALPGSGSGR